MADIWFWITLVFGALSFLVLSSQTLYLLVFSVAGKLYDEKNKKSDNKLNRFAIYIPSYREDAVIISTASQAVALNYPPDLFHVIVIADSLKPETLSILKKMPLQVVEVAFEKSTKAKALNKAIRHTEDNFDFAIVFDADNVATPDYLYLMNAVFNQGFMVVQGQRTAKNQNTPMAILDAISEAINNHIFRKGHRVLGASAAIIGSGMGLEFRLFREVMEKITAVGGFDKEMELYLLRRRIKIAYAESAIVFDEKVQQTEVFEKQRKRWLAAQFNYLGLHAVSGFSELLLRGNLDYFDKVFQMALIPRVMLLAILPFAFLLSLLPGAALPPLYWLIVWIIGYLAIILAVPASFLNKRLVEALLQLPAGIFSFFKVLFRIKGANKSFIHTPHGNTTNKS